MKRVYRRVMFFISTIVFLSLAPLVILYAMGYRTVASNVDPIPVGVLLVESFPRRVEVIVNSQMMGRTPRAVPNLPAGKVHIALTKDGYTSWEKTIQIAPGLVTEVRDVRLFLSTLVPNIIVPDATLVALSPNRQLLAVYSSDRTLQIFDQDGLNVTPPLTLLRSPHDMLWSPTSATLLLQNLGGSVDLFDIATPSVGPRPIPVLAQAQHIVWDPRIPSRLLAQTPQGSLRVYNTATQASAILATGISGYATTDRQIYVVSKDRRIKVYNLQGGLVRTLPGVLPAPLKQALLTPDGRLALLLQTDELLLLRDEELTLISTNVLSAAWSPDGRMLLVQPETNALYVYNEADEHTVIPLRELHLVTRLSRPITQPQWFAGGQHVVYQVDDEVRIVEIDARDHTIDTLVDTTNLGNAHAMVGEDGQLLFYLKRMGEQTSLVRTLLVRDE